MLFYTLLKFILKIALRVFFRRFQVDGLDKLHRAKGPLILAVNHPNTFMDPLIIATLVRQRVAFIANGSIFNRFTRPIFRYFHVIPVYRKKDTAESKLSPAELNKRTFQRCYDYLETKGPPLQTSSMRCDSAATVPLRPEAETRRCGPNPDRSHPRVRPVKAGQD